MGQSASQFAPSALWQLCLPSMSAHPFPFPPLSKRGLSSDPTHFFALGSLQGEKEERMNAHFFPLLLLLPKKRGEKRREERKKERLKKSAKNGLRHRRTHGGFLKLGEQHGFFHRCFPKRSSLFPKLFY